LIRSIIIFFIILTNVSFAEIKKINIVGNARVSSATIESLVDKKTSNIDSIYINNLTKKIYDTDFFADVKISFNQDVLTIKNASGYYQASITPEVIKIDNNQINLIINIDKKEISKIKNIYFIGNKYFSNSQLMDVITSSEDGWWKLFSTSALSEQRIEYDKQLLKEFYKSKSFYDAQIESAFASVDNNNKFTLTYSINSGPKYKFGDYDLKVSGLALKEEDVKEIKSIFSKLLKNESYSPQTINKINKQITEFLENRRYGNFEINIQDIKAADDKINLIVQLNEGQKSLVNKINIRGNTITEEKVIRDNLIISEGDQLNSSKVKKSIDNVKSKQLFSKVDYKIEDSDKKNFKDLNLFVKEQPTGSISAGLGYGTNGGLFEASVNERNFLGQGINLNFTGRLSSDVVRGELSYLDPNYINSNKELAASIFSEVDDYKNSGYQNKRAGTRFATKYEVYEDIFFRPNLGVQFDKLEVTGDASSLLRSRQGDFITTSFGYNFLYDQRDSKFNPTSGSIIYFDQNIATFFSDIPTIQTGVGVTLYKELFSDKFIGSAKGRLANVTAFNDKDVKLSDRIFASSNDLRGFEQRGVGPVDSGDHIGGNNLSTLSLKSTFPNPIPENLRATTFLFLDMGNVWGADYSSSISDSSKLRTSTGIALDLMSPIGPLSFTYSIPLSKASTDKEQNFLFNIGSSF